MAFSEQEFLSDRIFKYFSYQKEVFGDELLLDNLPAVNTSFDKNDFGMLKDVHKQIEDCTKCSLYKTINNKVIGEGNENAKLLLIGEAPGREEDLSGKPFVGKAGSLLDKILKAIGFTREEVYICNVLKCRPPQNRDPEQNEVKNCFAYLEKQIEIINPGIVLALGRFAGQTLLNTKSPINQLRNEIREYKGIPVFVTYHPAALLRDESKKYYVWEDIKKLRKTYDTIIGDKPLWHEPKK